MNSKFANNLHDSEQIFNSLMAKYEERLTEASGTGNGSAAVSILSSIRSEFGNFKKFDGRLFQN